jgi:glycosyltransferase involved in cell wall biosynthesis
MVGRSRVLISQQGCIPIYRKSFFERLNSGSEIEFVVVHGRAPRGSDIIEAVGPFNFPNIKVRNREIRIGGRSFLWQPVFWRAVRGEFDAAVIGEEVKYLSSIAVALVLWLRNRPFVLWGFGYHQYDRPQETSLARISASIAGGFKRMLYRVAAGYLVYTKRGELALRGLSSPPRMIAVLRNTVDMKREAQFRAMVAFEPLEQALQELGLRTKSTKLLYFGRLIATKYVDLLVAYARHCAESGRDVEVIIFGQGADKGRLQALSAGLANVAFHSHEDLKLARSLRVSAAVVIPGYVGLAVTHAFAHGVPIVTRRGQMHSPEVEYIEEGINGLMLPEAPAAFFAALDAFVDDCDLQRRLATGAEQTARTFDMDHMVSIFRGLVCECLKSSGKA